MKKEKETVFTFFVSFGCCRIKVIYISIKCYKLIVVINIEIRQSLKIKKKK